MNKEQTEKLKNIIGDYDYVSEYVDGEESRKQAEEIREELSQLLTEAENKSFDEGLKQGKKIQKIADSEAEAEGEFKVNENYIMWGFRYALGRRTGAVLDVVETLNRVWEQLKPFTQQQIKEEIQTAISQERAGGKCDVESWKVILSQKGSSEGEGDK